MAARLRPPMILGWSREVELLLCLARPRIGAETLSRIRTLLQEPVDWGALIAAALSQDVLPLVYHHLTVVCGDAVSEGLRPPLDRHLERTAARYASLSRNLVRVFQMLEQDGTPTVPFKGCVLAAAAYANPAHREFQDLDFLIQQRDALRAKDALIAAGYRLDTPVKLNGFPANGDEYRFIRDSDGLAVELCWRITMRHSLVSLDLGRLSSGATVVLAGATVPTLTPEDHLLVVCVHGSKHVWLLLRWLCDVAALLDRFPDINWAQVREQARRAGCWRAVALGLHLAHEWLGAPLPEPVLRAIASERGIEAAAAMVGERLFLGDGGIAAAKQARFHRYLAERLRDRLWIELGPLVHLLYDFVTPGERDRAALRLPARLSALYYALRPLRLAIHYGGAPLRKARPRKTILKPR